MNCARWQRLVALYVGDDLDRSHTARVEHHLSACPSCRDLEHDLRRDRLYLRDLDSAAAAALELGSVRGAVMAKVETGRTPTAVFFRPPVLAALSVVVVVIALGIMFRQGQRVVTPRNVTREIPSTAPELVAEPGPVETPLPQTPPAVVHEPLNTATTRLARAEPHPRGPTTLAPVSAPAEPMTIKILTDDPEVVIYWIVDPKGDKENV